MFDKYLPNNFACSIPCVESFEFVVPCIISFLLNSVSALGKIIKNRGLLIKISIKYFVISNLLSDKVNIKLEYFNIFNHFDLKFKRTKNFILTLYDNVLYCFFIHENMFTCLRMFFVLNKPF